jgi:hypothetical protein
MKVTTLLARLEELRNFLHSSIVAKTRAWEERDKGSWSKLWTSFDNIHDTQKAIERFKVGDTGKLGIFGLLQAMVVQQDAIMHLEQAMGLNPTKLADLPRLKEIRELRDETTGHPTNTHRKGRSSSYSEGTITYTTMWANESTSDSKGILPYYVWSATGSARREVDLYQAIDDQARILEDIIQEVIDELARQESEHKKRFIGSELQNLFQQTNYLFSKLYSYEHTREYSQSCLNQLEKEYVTFKEEMIKRYGKLALKDYQAIPGVYEECKKLDEVIRRVRERILLADGADELELDVYIESAQHSFEQLEVFAKEVDETFNIK